MLEEEYQDLPYASTTPTCILSAESVSAMSLLLVCRQVKRRRTLLPQ
jgi:hypothetical protein